MATSISPKSRTLPNSKCLILIFKAIFVFVMALTLSSCILSRSVNRLSLGVSLPGAACLTISPLARVPAAGLLSASLSLFFTPPHATRSYLVPTSRLVSPDARGGEGVWEGTLPPRHQMLPINFPATDSLRECVCVYTTQGQVGRCGEVLRINVHTHFG